MAVWATWKCGQPRPRDISAVSGLPERLRTFQWMQLKPKLVAELHLQLDLDSRGLCRQLLTRAVLTQSKMLACTKIPNLTFHLKFSSRPTFFKPHHQVSIYGPCSNKSDVYDHCLFRILELFVFVKNIVDAFIDRSTRISPPYRRSNGGHDRLLERHGCISPRL